jgi:hypothetical protein
MANQKARHGSAAGDERDAKARPSDEYDRDLERDNRRDAGEGGTMADLANPGASAPQVSAPVNSSGGRTDQGEFPQHARRGQAESPVEETLNQPEHHREGHPGGARDS